MYLSREAPYARLVAVGSALALESSYHPDLVADLKAQIPPDGRRWDAATRRWLVDPTHAQTVQAICREHLGIDVAIPKMSATPIVETRIIRVEYLGATKDRGDGGERTAFGFADGSWSVVFPENVLRSWFEGETGEPERPSTSQTLYAQLGVPQAATEADVRSAYRRLARQWHPDVCHESDAAAMFKRIQHAYEVLADSRTRKKYNAGLALESSLGRKRTQNDLYEYGYRPILRCGYVLVEGTEAVGRFRVSKIMQWEDILDSEGRTMVSSWPTSAQTFTVEWR